MKKTTIIQVVFAFMLLSCGRKKTEATPVRMDITETVFAPGTLEPENEYNLTAQTEGYIKELPVKEGDTVKAGDLLVVIDNPANNIGAGSAEALYRIAVENAGPGGPAVQQAVQAMGVAKKKMQEDSLQESRYMKLVSSNSVSKVEYENVKLAYESSRASYLNAQQSYSLAIRQSEQQLIAQKAQRDVNAVSNQYNEVRAIVGGKVFKRMKERGDYVRRGEIIAMIGDAANVYALLNVDEENIAKVKTGQDAIVQLNTNKDDTLLGKVTQIDPSFDERSQSFTCRVHFTSRLPLQIAGTQLQANIITAKKKNALVIPREFLDFSGKVTVKKKGPVHVRTGFISGNWVEVLDSLNEKDIITREQN